MYARTVRRKCGVRGCKNTKSFSISLTREAGNSVIICESCLKEGLNAVHEANDVTKSGIRPEKEAEIPGLFFNDRANGTEDPKQSERVEVAIKQESDFCCPNCEKRFDSERGLKIHMKSCEPKEEVHG